MIGATGWIRNDDAVDAVTIALSAAAGESIIVGDAPALKGHSKVQIERGVMGVFPWLAEIALFGALKAAFHQKQGTCVGQGTARALQDSWWWALTQAAEIGLPVEIAVEPIYAGSRVVIGKGRIRGDGSNGAWATQYVHDFGVVPRGVHGKYDLSKPNEALAVAWGAPGHGVPQEVVAAGKGIKVRCKRCMTGDDISDAAWGGYAMAFCGTKTYGKRNAEGISRLSESANHCTEALGGAVSNGGNILIGGQQSWGASHPAGPMTLKFKGNEVPLREGGCMVPVEDYAKQIKSGGEMWAFQISPGEGFREGATP